MATVRGLSEVKSFLQNLPAQLERNVLRGAARAMAKVVADEAKLRTNSEEVRGAIKTAVKVEGGRIVAKIQTKGPGAYMAPWEEYGTEAHFISVDDSQRRGMTVDKINRTDKDARKAGKIGAKESLIIGGNFVGATVFHPGARAHPFLRPALDIKAGDAVAAGQGYINSRIARGGIATPSGPEGDDA